MDLTSFWIIFNSIPKLLFWILKINVIFPKLLEYLIQNDGSVVCKWCGEVLPSRTRWYRHKYKLHVSTQVAQPAPLFKCHSCNAYFKSRKGYIGHLSSRHSDNENDENREEPGNKKPRKTSDVSIKSIFAQYRVQVLRCLILNFLFYYIPKFIVDVATDTFQKNIYITL